MQKTSEKINREWYQSANTVTIDIFVKNISPNQIHIKSKANSLELTIQLGECKEYALDLDLCGRIIPAETITKAYASKISITMTKDTECKWKTLENQDDEFGIMPWADTSKVDKNLYPSSNPKAKERNWDQYKNVEDDKDDNQKLLDWLKNEVAKGDPDKLNAINKSMQDSCCTSLTTNWADVKDKKVEPVIGKGVELKHWNS